MGAIQITALHDPVAIVHIPIALAPSYESKLYWTVVEAAEFSEEFFNVTSNTLEIAIFASTELINREWSIDRETDVRISPSWRVFEISSGDEGDEVNYDSPHLRHVSAPLAKAGITILYQSSYFTDFLLVKESDFERASRIFGEQGWQVDPVPPPPPTTAKRLSLNAPLTPITAPSTPSSSTHFRPSPPPPSLPEITVLGSPLACVGFPKSLAAKTQETIHRFITWPERVRSSLLPSCSPTASALDLAVGSALSAGPRQRPFVSYTRTPEGSSLVTEVAILRGLFIQDEGVQAGTELLGDLEAIDGGDDRWADGDDSDSNGESEAEPEDPEFDDAAEGYVFSSTSRAHSATALGRHVYTPPPDDFIVSQAYSLPPTPGGTGEEVRISWSTRTRNGAKTARSSGGGHRRSASPAKKARMSYSPAERVSPPGSIYSAGEFKEEEEAKEDGEERKRGRKACLQLDCRSLDVPQEDGDSYHLDSCGLLTRFSTLLESDGIKMLYSSTFHTANILVEARDVRRAKRLLEKRRSLS